MTCKGLSFKGQSSVEFLLVVGIALAISAPFLLSAQQSVLNVQETSKSVSLETSLDKIEEAVTTVSVSGEPAMRTFNVDIPDSVLKAQIVQDRGVVYTVRNRGGISNRSIVFDTNISAPQGLPNQTGRSRISVFAWNGQVNISPADSVDLNFTETLEIDQNDAESQNDSEDSTEPLEKGIFFVENDKMKFLDTNQNKVTTVYSSEDVNVIGPQDQNYDGDKWFEVPFVTAEGNLKIVDSQGEVQSLAGNSKSQKSRLAMDTGDSTTKVLYPGDSNNNYEIYSVSVDSSPQELHDPRDGVSAVSGVARFKSDSNNETVFVDGSQTLQYVDNNGNIKSTGVGVGSNNNIGIGHPYDFDGDGIARAPIVDGSNNLALVDRKGKKEALTQSGPARKSGLAVIDLDEDSEKEIAYIGKDDGTINYIDDVLGNNIAKQLEPVIKPDKSAGIAARLK